MSSTPRRSSRIRARNEEKLSKSDSLRSKSKAYGEKRLKRAQNAVLDSSSEEEVSTIEEGEEEVDPSTLISPVTKKHRPNNFLKV